MKKVGHNLGVDWRPRGEGDTDEEYASRMSRESQEFGVARGLTNLGVRTKMCDASERVVLTWMVCGTPGKLKDDDLCEVLAHYDFKDIDI